MTITRTKTAPAGAVELTETDLTTSQGGAIRIKPVFVSSYQTGGSSGDARSSEQFSFNYTKVEFEY